VDNALRLGLRALPGGSSLAQLLAEKRNVRNIQKLPPLTEAQIVQWADEFHERTGTWPTLRSGPIPNSGGEKWSAIEIALRNGARGQPGGSSLARLLAEHRGVRNRMAVPPLSIPQVLSWADGYFQRAGNWPTRNSGPIADSAGETWMAVDMALHKGRRGLSGISSLALLLAQERSVRNAWTRPNFTIRQILAWADAVYEQTGQWPQTKSGPIAQAPGESWSVVNSALGRGQRGLLGGSSLAKLLALERGVRNQVSLPRLSEKRILAWANAHHRRNGECPTKASGPIPEAPGDTWAAMDAALRQGNRGLQGGSPMSRLLAELKKKRNIQALPRLSRKKILAWADSHFHRTGKWPNVNSGPMAEAPEERWKIIDNALRQGHRGLRGGSSLLQLLVKKRGVRDPLKLPPLTEEQILGWAKSHFERTGSWPKHYSGAVFDAPGETWTGLNFAITRGKRVWLVERRWQSC
jgi:hypothetical protein